MMSKKAKKAKRRLKQIHSWRKYGCQYVVVGYDKSIPGHYHRSMGGSAAKQIKGARQ